METRSAVRAQSPNDQHIQSIQDAINNHWESFPRQAKSFILDTLSEKNVYSLLTFWSSPQHIEFASGNVAGSMCGASWYLALLYLKLGKYKEAKALTINGSFLYQCYVSISERYTPVYYIKNVYSFIVRNYFVSLEHLN